MGEAVVLSAEDVGAAAVAMAVEVLALSELEMAGVVAAAEALAGEGADGAGQAVLFDGGAEAWHGGFLRAKEKAAMEGGLWDF